MSAQTAPALNGEILVDPKNAPPSAHIEEHTNAADPAETASLVECDVLVVGAGFSGITSIDRVRKIGLSVKCFESGTDFGGVWYWNRYPGARVDSEYPFYQLNIREAYKTWTFSQRFPGHQELREYMAHLDKTLDLRKDTYFNARVNSATWDDKQGRWNVTTRQGHRARSKYLILASGLLHRTFTPDFPGMDSYKGEVMHTGAFPEDWSAKGKKVALIGAGATAVQVTQEVGVVADELTVLLRRPSTCLAMGQRSLTREEQDQMKVYFAALFKEGRNSRAGFPLYADEPRNTYEFAKKEDLEERLNYYWAKGGFTFLSSVDDTTISKDANKLVYDFWRRKVCERLTDPEKQKIMAPEVAPYYFGTKRPPLEHNYYEVLNQSNVKLVDLNSRPLKGFHEKGLIVGEDERLDFDAVILATGFDSFSGSMTQMGLKSKDGVPLEDIWGQGIQTYLGLTVPNFPNMFMSYTPQSPTALSNGTTIIEAQVETIVDMISKLERENAKSLTPSQDAADQWKAEVDAPVKHTLLPYTNSWWNGSNIPGKKVENQTYILGIQNYEAQCRATMDGWKGFTVVSATA